MARACVQPRLKPAFAGVDLARLVAMSDAELAEVAGSDSYPGGYAWGCDQMDLGAAYITRDDVNEALHLGEVGSGFSYRSSGPASVTLYPELVKKMRILIYNGDADDCVPVRGGGHREGWGLGESEAGVLPAPRFTALHVRRDHQASP